MGTHSMIGMVQEDGTVRAIFCNWDGYPAHVGRILDAHYSDPAKVSALLDLGDLSVLAEEIGERRPFDVHDLEDDQIDPRWETWCLAYWRDRGEPEQEAQVFASVRDYAVEIGRNADEYRYLFDGKAWFVLTQHGQFAGKWDDVREAMKGAA